MRVVFLSFPLRFLFFLVWVVKQKITNRKNVKTIIMKKIKLTCAHAVIKLLISQKILIDFV